MFSCQFNVSKAAWLSNPNLRWNAGLNGAGLQFRQTLQISQYPPLPPNPTYQRTGTLAKKAGWRITEEGRTMEFGSTEYLPYLLYGTGIFGPNAAPITPKSAKMLAWQNGGPSGPPWIFAKQVKGMIWPGKIDEIKTNMKQGFKDGISSYKGQ